MKSALKTGSREITTPAIVSARIVLQIELIERARLWKIFCFQALTFSLCLFLCLSFELNPQLRLV